ncbi:MAG: DegV family protein [Chloroflexi bacterium]|nr:MAG: DegV family protein [Chloroflexota bacterium]
MWGFGVVRIVTDSPADIPPVLAKELGIVVIPLYVRFGSEVYRDGVDLTPDEFYRKLVTNRSLPVTSTPAPGEIAQVYDTLAEETDEIVSIHVSSKLSATYEVALQAREQMKKKCRVELVDSMSGAMGEGLVVIAAAKEARKGTGLEQVANLAREAALKSHVYMCFDTLEFLRRGGRIGRAQALLGSVLKVNPIIGVKDGETHPYGRERSRAKAIDRVFDFVKSLPSIGELAVEHASTPDEAEALADRLGGIFPRERIYMSRVAPAVGVHVGPHVIAVSALEGQ